MQKYKKIVGLPELKQLSEQRYFEFLCPDGTTIRIRLSELIQLDIKVIATPEEIEVLMHDGPISNNMVN